MYRSRWASKLSHKIHYILSTTQKQINFCDYENTTTRKLIVCTKIGWNVLQDVVRGRNVTRLSPNTSSAICQPETCCVLKSHPAHRREKSCSKSWQKVAWSATILCSSCSPLQCRRLKAPPDFWLMGEIDARCWWNWFFDVNSSVLFCCHTQLSTRTSAGCCIWESNCSSRFDSLLWMLERKLIWDLSDSHSIESSHFFPHKTGNTRRSYS